MLILLIHDIVSFSPLTTFAVANINFSLPQEVRDQRAVKIEFSETLFDVNSVRVMFSSNCTSSVTADYSNPLLITIPDTGANTGQCQYNIQLVAIEPPVHCPLDTPSLDSSMQEVNLF